jgi:hypothetical protein
MLHSRKHARVLTCIALTLGGAANAGIISNSSNVEVISPPASVALDQLVSSDKVRVFKESTVTLSNPLRVDGVLAGDYPPNVSAELAAGRTVSSYLAHTDPMVVGADVVSYFASITFDSDILGLIFLYNTLASSDSVLGTAQTVYPGFGGSDFLFRELEFYGSCAVDTNDCLSLSSDRRTISIAWSTGAYSDQLRIVVESNDQVNLPMPATLALLSMGLMGIAAVRRKRDPVLAGRAAWNPGQS